MEKYERSSEVGSGSFGVVWKAVHKENHEVVAIKKLIEAYRTDEECLNLREIKSLAKMGDHPNIVKLKEIIRENDTLFLVMEYMEGGDLYNHMVSRTEKQQPFSETEIRDISYQILQGLAHLHYKGYFHRDLKPENLLVSKNRRTIKIGDLGMAREMNGRPPYTRNVTTLWYRAPEVILDSPFYSSSVDMWAVGAIMAELYTNKALFQGWSEGDVMGQICRVIGTPTQSTWLSGLDLARNMGYMFPHFPGVGLDSELLPTACSNDAIKLIRSLLSWNPSQRPTAMEVLQHPYFRCYSRVPPSIENMGYHNIKNNYSQVMFITTKNRELLKEASINESSDTKDYRILRIVLSLSQIFCISNYDD